MNNIDSSEEILKEIEIKYQAINQKTETQLEGLLWSKPITYWDYIQTDALLSLQVQRTTLPDEMVFIMYHQVNELIFKMILWEMRQISYCENITTKFGEVSTMVFRPLVQSGRVFKEQESLTVWISDDDNKLPIRIKASLAVGSIKADIEAYRGLKNPFKTNK